MAFDNIPFRLTPNSEVQSLIPALVERVVLACGKVDGNQFLAGDGEMGWGWGTRRRRGADTSYQRDDDVARYRVGAVPVSTAWNGGVVIAW